MAKELKIVGGIAGVPTSNDLKITPGRSPGTGKANIKIYPTFTFEGNICFKDGEIYGRIVEDNESHTIVEVKGTKKGEYPDRHEFRKYVPGQNELSGVSCDTVIIDDMDHSDASPEKVNKFYDGKIKNKRFNG